MELRVWKIVKIFIYGPDNFFIGREAVSRNKVLKVWKQMEVSGCEDNGIGRMVEQIVLQTWKTSMKNSYSKLLAIDKHVMSMPTFNGTSNMLVTKYLNRLEQPVENQGVCKRFDLDA